MPHPRLLLLLRPHTLLQQLSALLSGYSPHAPASLGTTGLRIISTTSSSSLSTASAGPGEPPCAHQLTHHDDPPAPPLPALSPSPPSSSGGSSGGGSHQPTVNQPARQQPEQPPQEHAGRRVHAEAFSLVGSFIKAPRQQQQRPLADGRLRHPGPATPSSHAAAASRTGGRPPGPHGWATSGSGSETGSLAGSRPGSRVERTRPPGRAQGPSSTSRDGSSAAPGRGPSGYARDQGGGHRPGSHGQERASGGGGRGGTGYPRARQWSGQPAEGDWELRQLERELTGQILGCADYDTLLQLLRSSGPERLNHIHLSAVMRQVVNIQRGALLPPPRAGSGTAGRGAAPTTQRRLLADSAEQQAGGAGWDAGGLRGSARKAGGGPTAAGTLVPEPMWRA